MTPEQALATMRAYTADVTQALQYLEESLLNPDSPTDFESSVQSFADEARWLTELAENWEETDWDDTFEDHLPT